MRSAVHLMRTGSSVRRPLRLRRGRGLWEQQAQALVRKEEKRLILEDGTANHPAKVILAERRFDQRRRIKIISRIEEVVSQIVERRAVELIGAGFRRNRDLGSGSSSEFWSIRRSLDSELLHGIHRYESVSAASGSESRNYTAQTFTKVSDRR